MHIESERKGTINLKEFCEIDGEDNFKMQIDACQPAQFIEAGRLN